MRVQPVLSTRLLIASLALATSMGLPCGALSGRAEGAPLPIQLDGAVSDWGGATPLHTDANGDGSSFDFGRLWVADDARFLFLRLEVGIEGSLDENNALVVYLDTDNNTATGLAVSGIGAELEWKLGSRSGTYYRGGSTWSIFHDDIRFRSLPTVTATEFELCFGRDTLPNGSQPLFFGSTLKLVIKDTAAGGDQLPNVGQTLSYTLDQGPAPTTDPIGFARLQPTDLRICTQNVLSDGIYAGTDQPRFRRLYQAVAGDIYALQEIYNHTGTQTEALLESWFPGTPFYSADVNDCQTISRYPIDGSWAIDGNLATLIDTTPAIGHKLLLVNAHLPCCTNDAGRQQEIDHILQFLRDAMYEPGGQLDLAGGTAIAVTGDLNLVGLAQQLRSLTDGDVVDQATYGTDFHPDWDGTGLADIISRQTEKRTSYTWRSDTSSFWPGRLDFFIFSDSVLEPANHYLVYTHEMSAGALAANGLQAGDSDASDHLLQVRDLRPVAEVDTPAVAPPTQGLRISPNPLWGTGQILLAAPLDGPAEIAVFDATGRSVRQESRFLAGETNALAIDVTNLASGNYWLRFSTAGRREVTPFTVLARR
ncbi:MAG: T9SS type A sorting domain-containing protein [Candidatus Eisenbacteria bacterium]|nr:T9SS type A sorting domain-containing protein [Candidatus Eisenbacteria bacterium]